MTFGEKIQALRKQQNISQEEFAEKLEASRSAVSRWEKDQSMPELDKLIMISDMFSVSLDYLLRDKPLETDTEAISDFIPLRTLFKFCTIINILGLVSSMYGWHRLQSPFFVIIGLLMNMLACVFFEILQPKDIDRAKAHFTRKRFYLANAWVLLPTPIYVAIEIISYGEHYDIVAPHIIPFAVYIVMAIGVTAYLIYKNKK